MEPGHRAFLYFTGGARAPAVPTASRTRWEQTQSANAVRRCRGRRNCRQSVPRRLLVPPTRRASPRRSEHDGTCKCRSNKHGSSPGFGRSGVLTDVPTLSQERYGVISPFSKCRYGCSISTSATFLEAECGRNVITGGVILVKRRGVRIAQPSSLRHGPAVSRDVSLSGRWCGTCW